MAEEEKLDASKDMSFWDHLEDLRHGLFRVVIALLAAFVVLFFFKDFLFFGRFHFIYGDITADTAGKENKHKND